MRKRIISLFLLALLCFVTYAQDNIEAIKQTVLYWNDLHNSKSVNEFKQLYAPDVLFYGKYRNLATCLKEKAVLYRIKSFHQDITSAIKVTFYSSGTIKSSFTKRVTYKQRIKEYPAYLLLIKRDGNYIITGESDLLTDEKLAVQLDLGDELNKHSTPTFLIVFIVAIVAVGTWFIIQRRRKGQQSMEEFILSNEVQEAAPSSPVETPPSIDTAFIQKIVEEKVLENLKKVQPQQAAEVIEVPDEHAKGKAFEEYIVALFPKSYFRIIEWRGDKYSNGRYAESNRLPDLELRLETKSVQVPFAVECKWRKGFYEGKINWAKDYQLKNYKQYQHEKNIAVFVIIGVGGEPSDPESLYVVPLEEIESAVLYQQELQPYYRYSKGNFFLNHNRMRLE